MWYRIALFLHVTGAISLFFMTGVGVLILLRLPQARTVAQVREWHGAMRIVERAMPLIVTMILGSALYMVFTAWGWQTPWIDVALATVVGISIVATTLRGPRVTAIFQAAEAAPDGPLPAALRARIHDPVLWMAEVAMTTTTVGLVFLMTVKPDMPLALADIAITCVPGIALGRRIASAGALRDSAPASVSSTVSRRVA
jgi:hypothetical protein